MHVTYTDVMLMQKLQSTPLLFFRWRACKLGLALVIAITAHATHLRAEDQQASPAAQGNALAAERAPGAEGYVWVDKDGKAVISNLPRNAQGAPIADPAADATPPRNGFYQWTDANGVTHLTNQFEKVPEDQRGAVVFHPLPEPELFGIELPPALRAVLPVDRPERWSQHWRVAGLVGACLLLLFFVLWRRNRKLRPDPAVFAKRAIDGETGADGASATNGAPLNPEAKLAAHYKLIGVAPEALSSEVRKAYHRRMGEYHPDKVVGLGQELRLLAEAKSREINEAYEAILFSRGEA